VFKYCQTEKKLPAHSVPTEIYSGIARFLCDSTPFLFNSCCRILFNTCSRCFRKMSRSMY